MSKVITENLIEIIGILIALVALLIALFTWLAPFEPIGPSPFGPTLTPILTNTPTKTSTFTPTPTDTPTKTPTFIPTPTNTPTKTPTFTPTPTNTPTKTPTLTPILTPQLLTVRPACGDTYTVASRIPIELRYGIWRTRGLELGTIHTEHLKVILLLDGQIVSGEKQPVRKVTNSYPGASCGVDIKDGYGTFYIAQIDALTSGEHFIQMIYSFDIQVIESYDSDITYGPGEFGTLEFTIIAEP